MKEEVELIVVPVKEFFYNEESQWGTYKIEVTEPVANFKMVTSFKNETIYEGNLTGNMQRLDTGVEYRVSGTTGYNVKYGALIEPIKVLQTAPSSTIQQQRFLESLVTSLQAKTIISQYPTIVQDVIDGVDNVDCTLLKGITPKIFENIKVKITDNFIIADILSFLSPLGVSYKMIKSLVQHESNPALLKQKLTDNPYLLTSVKGLGFKKVDVLALKLNPDLINSKFRAIAYIKYKLKETGNDEGHVWLKTKTLKSNFIDNVPQCIDYFDSIIEEQKNNSTFLHVENETVGLKSRYDIENNIYCKLIEIASTETKFKNKINDEIIQCGLDKANEEQGFCYDTEQENIIKSAVNSKIISLSGLAGCVDCDTEYFNGKEWKKISRYKHHEKVLQYNKNGTAELVRPLDYIKQPQEELYHLINDCSIDQCLSSEHNVYYLDHQSSLVRKTMKEIKEEHEQEINGFGGKFITTFEYGSYGTDVTDDELMLIGILLTNGYLLSKKLKHCIIELSFVNQKMRIEELLKRLDIPYKSFALCQTKLLSFCIPNSISKISYENLYKGTNNQLEILCSSCNVSVMAKTRKGRICFELPLELNKEVADIFQFAFSSIGRQCQLIGKNGKYIVSVVFERFAYFNTESQTKPKIEKYTTLDGYKYCFTVNSGMLVLRRNGKIFITGNSSKTTISRGILSVFKGLDLNISCCALSAKAAKVIKNSTGFDSSTMHKLFGIGMQKNEEESKEDKFITTDVLMIDELSMVNSYLVDYALSHIQPSTIVLLVGDDKQLPPIGYGNVLRDILQNKESLEALKLSIYTKHLTKIYRQAEKSGIIHDANIIRQNKSPLERITSKVVTGELKDMFYMFFDDKEKLHKEALNKYIKTIEKEGLENTAMICPINDGSINSSNVFNQEIQDILLKGNKSIEHGEQKYYEGAKVMQIVNNYQTSVMNGEEGIIVEIYDKGCKVKFGDNIVDYKRNNLSSIKLAYCNSVHKQQGSGISTVVYVMDNSSYKLLDSCLFYTAITRAKKRCLVISTPYAFNQCIKTNNQINRQTYLDSFFKK